MELNMLKKIDYHNPVVSSYLFLGVVFILIGISKGLAFLLIGICSIAVGIQCNEKA